MDLYIIRTPYIWRLIFVKKVRVIFEVLRYIYGLRHITAGNLEHRTSCMTTDHEFFAQLSVNRCSDYNPTTKSSLLS